MCVCVYSYVTSSNSVIIYIDNLQLQHGRRFKKPCTRGLAKRRIGGQEIKARGQSGRRMVGALDVRMLIRSFLWKITIFNR